MEWNIRCKMKKNVEENNQKKHNWGNEWRGKMDLQLEKCREQRLEKRKWND